MESVIVEMMTNQQQYDEASIALQDAADRIEEALNWLAACGNYERRSELSYALGIVQGVNSWAKSGQVSRNGRTRPRSRRQQLGKERAGES